MKPPAAFVREWATCENGDTPLGAARTLRKHWRAGAAKARAEIMVNGLQRKIRGWSGRRDWEQRGDGEKKEELELEIGKKAREPGGRSPLWVRRPIRPTCWIPPFPPSAPGQVICSGPARRRDISPATLLLSTPGHAGGVASPQTLISIKPSIYLSPPSSSARCQGCHHEPWASELQQLHLASLRTAIHSLTDPHRPTKQTTITMADLEVASHYNLPSAYPEEWPAELDQSDESQDESFRTKSKKRQSRYSALGRIGQRKSIIPGDGRDSLVQKDEPDPLGSADSVVSVLKRQGLPVDDDARLRNRFLLSSTTFSPALFLSQVHSSDSTQSLLEGLDYLSRSIDQKSASLKVLVEANFERFVRAKATIDSVYTEMRNQGAGQEPQPSSSHRPNRSIGHLRAYSAGRAPSPSPAASPSPAPKKTALTKESEYGVKGIRAPLLEASVKAEEVWGPALGGRDREQSLKLVVNAMEKHRSIYEMGANLARSIRQRDFDSVFEQYSQARTLAKEAKSIADRAVSSQRQLTDEETHTILITGRMWMDVEQQIKAFKRDLWRRLSNVQTPSTTVTASGPVEEHMELIGALLELGVEDNPIWVWLLSRYDFIKTKIKAFTERSKVEIEILRRRLAGGEKPTPREVASHLRQATREGNTDLHDRLDTDQVIELWECIHTYLTRLLSLQSGLLGEVVDFWEAAQSFIDGTKQKLLPTGFEGESRKHHHLSSDNVRDLQNGVIELVNLIRESVLSLFADPPIDDVSLLFSPLPPPSPNAPIRSITPTESRFKLDPRNLPHPSPKRGEPWEDFAFWPPYSNSLSGVHYLSKFLILIGTAASAMAALRPVSSGGSTYDQLKTLVSVARERCVRAACAAWNKDAENCKMLEDWTRDPERRDLTKMPGLFVAFESTVLAGMQKIVYISEAMTKSDTVDVVTAPPAKLLQMVRTQFVSSVYKALSGLVENAESPVRPEEDSEWILVGPAVSVNGADAASSLIAADAVDSRNRVSLYIVSYPIARHAANRK